MAAINLGGPRQPAKIERVNTERSPRVSERETVEMSDPAATRGWLEDILLVLVEPGTGLKLVPIINCALVALICVLAITLLAVKSVHLIVMLVLAICLMASINWFVHELRKEDGVRDKAD